MGSTTRRPPLWEVMEQARDGVIAAQHPFAREEQCLAAEIRAVRDWLKEELPRGGPWYVLLTAEAERAEGGDGRL